MLICFTHNTLESSEDFISVLASLELFLDDNPPFSFLGCHDERMFEVGPVGLKMIKIESFRLVPMV